MKHVFTLTLVVFAIAVAGCQKANDTTRIGNSGPRSGGVTNTSIPNNLVLNGVVTTDQSYQSAFQQAVKDFMEAQIDPQYVGFVSSQGADQTGVFVAGRVELANGQPLSMNQNAGTINILPTSELLVAVYDKFSNQSNLPALPVTYLRQATGYIQGNQVFIEFFDQYGRVKLEGTFNSQNATLRFTYDTQRTFDGKQGYQGVMGDLHVPTCQFFRCQ
jgi:hypothetical protein